MLAQWPQYEKLNPMSWNLDWLWACHGLVSAIFWKGHCMHKLHIIYFRLHSIIKISLIIIIVFIRWTSTIEWPSVEDSTCFSLVSVFAFFGDHPYINISFEHQNLSDEHNIFSDHHPNGLVDKSNVLCPNNINKTHPQLLCGSNKIYEYDDDDYYYCYLNWVLMFHLDQIIITNVFIVIMKKSERKKNYNNKKI